MKYYGNPFCLIAACAIVASIQSSKTEEAHLAATINPGALEISPPSLSTEFAPIQADITLTGSTQADAITFNISDIVINDLNGDGLGWKLTAVPFVLSHTSNGSSLPIGTIVGFQNYSDLANTIIESPDELVYTSGSGVSNYTVDYLISYTVPPSASAGDYEGIVVFNIVSQ